jgi:hypothetical protein
MTTTKPREPLRGFVAIEDWTDDYSNWSGSICFPNPRGSNLHWENPIEFVEASALVAKDEELERTKAALEMAWDVLCCATQSAFEGKYVEIIWNGKDEIQKILKGEAPMWKESENARLRELLSEARRFMSPAGLESDDYDEYLSVLGQIKALSGGEV